MTNQMPEPWRSRAEELGLAPTYRGFAEKTGLGVETVRQAIIGTNRKPTAATVRRIAELLRMKPGEVDAWFGRGGSDLEPYEAPPAAARLTPKQRKALDNLILAMVEPEERKRSSRDEERADRELREARNRFFHENQDQHALAADTNTEVAGGEGPGAPAESL